MTPPRTLWHAWVHFAGRPTPWLIGTAWVGVLVARARSAPLELTDLLAAAIVVAGWPVYEWLIHVFVLHYRPRTLGGLVLDLPVAKTHRAHHAEPSNLALVFIPLHALFLSLLAAVAIGWGLTQVVGWGPTLSAGAVFLGLSFHYEWVHYLVHTAYVPTSARYRRLWKNHRLHHFKNETKWFGVTMLSGDRLLGTSARAADVATSAGCRDLLHEEP